MRWTRSVGSGLAWTAITAWGWLGCNEILGTQGASFAPSTDGSVDGFVDAPTDGAPGFDAPNDSPRSDGTPGDAPPGDAPRDAPVDATQPDGGPFFTTPHPVGGLAVNTNYVFWTDPALGHVLSCPLTGCIGNPLVIATADTPTAIAADVSEVFWTQRSTDDAGIVQAVVAICKLGGTCTSIQLAATIPALPLSAPDFLAYNKTYVAWSHGKSHLSLVPRPLAAVPTFATSAGQVAIDSVNVYYAALGTGAGAGVTGCTLINFPTSCQTPALFINFDNPFGLATDGTSVFYSGFSGTASADFINAALTNGNGPRAVTSGLSGPTLSLSSQDVLFAETAGTMVGRVSQAGGTPTTIATGQSTPDFIAVTPTGATVRAVFWVNAGNQIMASALP